MRGCANSVNAGGAALVRLGGTASTVDDTLQLSVSFMPPGTICMLFQGTVQDAGMSFSDGLLCATGTITRLEITAAPIGGATFGPGLSLTGGVPINGGLRTYQVWYRDAAVYCTSATNNLSNGFFVNWAR